MEGRIRYVLDRGADAIDIRKRIGDTGEDYPKVEAIIQEFWDYDEAAQKKAIQISHDYLAMKEKKKK